MSAEETGKGYMGVDLIKEIHLATLTNQQIISELESTKKELSAKNDDFEKRLSALDDRVSKLEKKRKGDSMISPSAKNDGFQDLIVE